MRKFLSPRTGTMKERMVRPAGFEPATYGFEVRTPESSQPPQNSEVIETKGFSVLQILGDFIDFGIFWNDFHTQIHTQNLIQNQFGLPSGSACFLHPGTWSFPSTLE